MINWDVVGLIGLVLIFIFLYIRTGQDEDNFRRSQRAKIAAIGTIIIFAISAFLGMLGLPK